MRDLLTSASLELVAGFLLVVTLTFATLIWLLYISRGGRAMQLDVRGLGLSISVTSGARADAHSSLMDKKDENTKD